MQKALVEVDEGIYTEQSKLTVKQWMETWLAEFTGDVKDSTRTSYRQHMNNHIIPALGAVKLSELTPAACQKFINDLSRVKGLSAKTVKNIHGIMSKALSTAVDVGYIKGNPTERVTLPRVEKKEIHPLTDAQVKAFMQECRGHEYERVFKLILFTGLREGEALGLTWDCVDFTTGTLKITKQLQKRPERDGGYTLAPLKNDKARTITAAPFVMQLLRGQERPSSSSACRPGNSGRAGRAWRSARRASCSRGTPGAILM
jgi:integrase